MGRLAKTIMIKKTIVLLRYFIIFSALWTLYSPDICAQELKSHEGYAEVTGGKVWYRILGESEKTPLLVLHGGPGGTSRSLYLFSPLAQDRPVILFDQLGSGRSTHHNDTSLLKIPLFVAQVEAVRKSLNLEKVIILGHSWGTALALEYYLAHPDNVEALIFNSPYFSTSVWEADADTLISQLPPHIQKAIEEGEATGNFQSTGFQKANRIFLNAYGLRTDRLKSHLDTVTYTRNSFIYNYMWGPTEFTATGTLKDYHRVEQLTEIKVPVLFITGEYDEARPQTVRYFQSLVPDSEMAVIKGAGHATMHDNRKGNIQAVRKFLDDL